MSSENSSLLKQIIVGVVISVVSAFLIFTFGFNNSHSPTDRQQDRGSQFSTATSLSPVAEKSIVGLWKTNTFEHGVSAIILWRGSANRSTSYLITSNGITTRLEGGSWRYSYGVLREKFADGSGGTSKVRWINDDTFDLTITENQVPGSSGIVRRYVRQ